MKRRRAAAGETPSPAPEITAEAMAKITGAVLSQAIADAIGKGYAVQLIPGGDPHTWRALADRAAVMLAVVETEPITKQGLEAWLADYGAAVEAYTLRAGDVATPAAPA